MVNKIATRGDQLQMAGGLGAVINSPKTFHLCVAHLIRYLSVLLLNIHTASIMNVLVMITDLKSMQ